MADSLPPPLHQALRLIIRANHILHQHGLVDAFGHISIRHPLAPDQYIIAAYDPGAPALVKSRMDFLAYYISDSSPVDKNAPQGYSERFIHGEIFGMFPDVNCVVHSHSEAVIPFTVSTAPVKPIFHMAGFLGAEGLPIFYAGNDMLIKNKKLGESLASSFEREGRDVVLQNKHGFTVRGSSVEEAIYRAIYTQANCRMLQQAIALAGGNSDKVDYLSQEEVVACTEMNKKTLDKSFRLWLREVQVNPLYETEEGEPDPPAVRGMKV